MKKNLRLFSLTILTIFIMVLETIYYKSCFSFNFSHIFWQFLAIFFFSNFLFYCEKRDNFFCQLHPIHFAFFYPYTVFSFCDWRNMIYLNLCIWLIVRKLKTVQFCTMKSKWDRKNKKRFLWRISSVRFSGYFIFIFLRHP